MPWTKKDYPSSFKNFNSKTRNKAIEIANALVDEEGYEEGRAIAIATQKAKEWASDRESLKKNGKDQHVVFKDGLWKVEKEGKEKASYTFDRKEDALEKAKEIASNQNVQVVVHKKDGKIEGKIIP